MRCAARKPNLADVKIYHNPPGGHLFDRRVSSRTAAAREHAGAAGRVGARLELLRRISPASPPRAADAVTSSAPGGHATIRHKAPQSVRCPLPRYAIYNASDVSTGRTRFPTTTECPQPMRGPAYTAQELQDAHEELDFPDAFRDATPVPRAARAGRRHLAGHDRDELVGPDGRTGRRASPAHRQAGEEQGDRARRRRVGSGDGLRARASSATTSASSRRASVSAA